MESLAVIYSHGQNDVPNPKRKLPSKFEKFIF
jgi:hypothetical protein